MSASSVERCAVCGSRDALVAYAGPIREGRFGTLTRSIEVLECEACGTRRLSERLEECSEFYESTTYREQVDGDASVAAFAAAHDAEQATRLALLGMERFADKVVADVGCGGGSFLGAIAEVAERCVAIEPAQHFRDHLRTCGYDTYGYASEARRTEEGTVDVVTCFSVIEHVEDPVALLSDIHALLAPGGELVLSTPNADDALLSLLPGDYERFFYRKAHLYYFTAGAITAALSAAGFSQVAVTFVQRFGLGNAVGWLRERRPMGDHVEGVITPALDEAWKSELERTGTADYLYIRAVKESL